MPTSSGDTSACHPSRGLLHLAKQEEPPLSLKDAFTDSGYASALAPSRRQKDDNPAHDDTFKPVMSVAAEDCDAQTVYSDEGSIGGAELDATRAIVPPAQGVNAGALRGRHDAGPGTDPVDSEITSSRISEWLVGLGEPGADESTPTCELQAAAALSEDEIHLPDKRRYRHVVFESAA
ncbi:hypothetical protein N658DRAFT_559776 [Parathielavia hyrcaniae]|uniref:Uncharacterized protein n=1 Tax=Parathielavia hyrcaniae TaxID=113614 RepID=A0AAN6PYT2_9PEZI|nr:hypothetical protein N658DRAFT_559776 [Parathielavia hyrcaniae]